MTLKYGMKVKVKSGFYEGLIGEVRLKLLPDTLSRGEIRVEFIHPTFGLCKEFFKEEELECLS